MEVFLFLKKEIFKFLGKGNEMLERSPMIKLSEKKNNWLVLNTKVFGNVWIHLEIKEFLKKLLRKNNAPWKK